VKCERSELLKLLTAFTALLLLLSYFLTSLLKILARERVSLKQPQSCAAVLPIPRYARAGLSGVVARQQMRAPHPTQSSLSLPSQSTHNSLSLLLNPSALGPEISVWRITEVENAFLQPRFGFVALLKNF
jgi:hypothetical protein